MKYSKDELAKILKLDQFPLSASYDPDWVLENQMGPNVLWLTEALSQVMALQPGMRVLDMGCGRAVSSIFLAKEFGLQVWATDLWIDASENWKRVCAAGMESQVFPIHAEAHNLPFAGDFFDAVLSMDAFHYFGTDDLYLGYFTQFVKPGRQIGIIIPGLKEELAKGIPEHLKPYWEWEFCCFHSPVWWHNHWEQTGKVQVEWVDFLPRGWEHWLKWFEVLSQQGRPEDAKEAEMVRVDAGRNLGFIRMVARKIKGESS